MADGSVAELVAWLRAQLDTDERTAIAAAEAFGGSRVWEAYLLADEDYGDERALGIAGRTITAGLPGDDFRADELEHIAEHDPARVLREVGGKRLILEEHPPLDNGACDRCDEGAFSSERKIWPCPTIRALALPYSHRPGYQEGWAP